MLNLLSRVRIVSDFYDVDWDGEKGIVKGREGVVVGLDARAEHEALFEVEVQVTPGEPEVLGYYAHELEVIDA